ncbi:hypothetical protein JTE90_021300 [Oedothorax gibbosus]|uniref:Uncharacterized protein n=1 Tax=Oedothorax gibbosus TaxID=931172 RepID=A0AAV6VNA0_9ARAC|nr:hypothetical protein JTE90_021300 [Oedothorax gibbosus]
MEKQRTGIVPPGDVRQDLLRDQHLPPTGDRAPPKQEGNHSTQHLRHNSNRDCRLGKGLACSGVYRSF